MANAQSVLTLHTCKHANNFFVLFSQYKKISSLTNILIYMNKQTKDAHMIDLHFDLIE